MSNNQNYGRKFYEVDMVEPGANIDSVAYYCPDVIPIIHGQVKFNVPGVGLVLVKVKQVKGQGVHDAINLTGKPADPQHLELIATALRLIEKEKQDHFTAEQLRFEVKRDRVGSNKMEDFKQSHFTRKLSELIYWRIIFKIDKKGVPVYSVQVYPAKSLQNGGLFHA